MKMGPDLSIQIIPLDCELCLEEVVLALSIFIFYLIYNLFFFTPLRIGYVSDSHSFFFAKKFVYSMLFVGKNEQTWH